MASPLETALTEGVCERGNTALSNEEGAVVIFAKIDDETFLQAAHTPGNYPAWDISLVKTDEAGVAAHINKTLSGWAVSKLNIDGVELDGAYVR